MNYKRGLTISEFLSVLMKCLGEFITDSVDFSMQVVELFKQIDVNGDGRVQWHEFTRYDRHFMRCTHIY